MNAPASTEVGATAPAPTGRQRLGWQVARWSWLALFALCVAWEAWLAPVRPGGSWLVLKALPLLLLARGLWRGDVRTFQWALMLVLAYLMEGSVRAFEPAPYGTLAWIELLLVALFFTAAIAYVQPFKRAARARAQARR
jgi:uncharacterized membrane protein